MKFSEKLMNLRKSKGLSQEDLATKLDVTRQTVSKWELDQTVPDMNKLMEISKLFEVSLDELVNDVEVANKETTYKENAIEKNNKKIAIKIFIVGIILCLVLCGVGGIRQIMAKRTNQKRYDNAYAQSQSDADNANARLEEIYKIGRPLETQISDLKIEISEMENERTKIFTEDRGFSDRYYEKDNEITKKREELSDLMAQMSNLNAEIERIQTKDYTVYYKSIKPISYLIFYYIGAGVFVLMSLIALFYYLATRKK